MPRDFAFTLQYESPVERVYAALVDVERWRRRVAGAANVDLVFGAAEPGAFEVTVTERGAVPAPLRRVVKGEFGLTRTDRWGPVESGTARGTFTGTAVGVGGTFSGTYLLRAAGPGSAVDVAGSLRVDVRGLGGALESMAEKLLTKIVRGERDDVEAWIGAHQNV